MAVCSNRRASRSENQGFSSGPGSSYVIGKAVATEYAGRDFLIPGERGDGVWIMRDIRRALGHGPVDLATLTTEEWLQHEVCQRRADTDAAVQTLHREGAAIKEIARWTGRSLKLPAVDKCDPSCDQYHDGARLLRAG